MSATRVAEPVVDNVRDGRFFRHNEWELYRFGLQVGWYNLRAGGLRRLGLQKTLGKLLQPIISPSRFSEYDAVVRELPLDGSVMLDVGSPKIFDLWLAARHRVDIVATDIWQVPAAEYNAAWQRMAGEQPVRGHLRFLATDGTRTCFPDASFDCIFAISVIEHIEGDGDARFLAEAARLLVPGGRLVVTVPFAQQYDEEYRKAAMYRPGKSSGRVFFQRVYDREAAERRLMRQEGLSVEAVKTLLLGAPELDRAWNRLPMRLRGVIGFLNPVLSGAMPRRTVDGFPHEQGRAPSNRSLAGDLLISYRRRG
jgi:predicted SAM-dependent methyltransferase